MTSDRLTPRDVATALGLVAGCIVISRLMTLSSSLGMVSDAPGYFELIREFALAPKHGRWLASIEMGHPAYVLWCGLVTHGLRTIWPMADPVFCIQAAGILAFASSVVPLYWLGVWWLRDRRLALLATWVYAAIPLTWWWSTEVMSDSTAAVAVVWSFGLMARWRATERTRWLVAACVVFGAVPLFRVSAIAFAPLFAWMWIAGARGRWLRLGAWSVALLALPTAVLLVGEWALFHRPFGAALERTAMHGRVDWGRLLSGEWWGRYGVHLVHGVGWVGLGVAALGLLGAVVRRGRFALGAVLWVAGTVTLPIVVVVVGAQMRMIVPLGALCALAIALGVGWIARPFGTRSALAGGVAAGVVGLALIVQATPDLIVLHARTHVGHAIAAWCKKHTPKNAFVVCEGEAAHVRSYARREAIHFFRDWTAWRSTGVFRGPECMRRIDAALRRGREVYVSGVLPKPSLEWFDRAYAMEEVACLPGETLRNLHDPGMAHLGDPMRETHDVTIFRARFAPDKIACRSTTAPDVSVRPDGRIEIRLTCPRAANRRAFPVLAARRAALDWLLVPPRPDPVFVAFGQTAQARYEQRVAADGTATFVVDPPPDATRLHAACVVLDEDGTPIIATVAADVVGAR